jgi:hypothetical protein
VDEFANVTASAAGPEATDELIYAWSGQADGPFSQEQLAPVGGSYSSLATDPLGRAYVVFVVENSEVAQPGVWLLTHSMPASG